MPRISSRLAIVIATATLSACASAPEPRATGNLGIVVERASGSLLIVETSNHRTLNQVPGLGDLSHASIVYSRDQRYAYVFGRDGGLTKVDLLAARIARRVQQAGNSIGGAISQDGRLVAVSNYTPGGVKVFNADTLDLVADIPTGSKVVGLVDAPGQRFVFSLFDKGEIWLADFSAGTTPAVMRFENAGRQPYDALITPDGRHYVAGLFGEDGLAVLDLWRPDQGVRRVLTGYGRGAQKLPVYKMPHLEGWAVAGNDAYLPAIGRHEVIVVDRTRWRERRRIAVAGQPVFVMARPDQRHLWVNFAPPHNDTVQIIDVAEGRVVHTLTPGRAVLHMEFTPRGEAVWLSVRDEDRVDVYDTARFTRLASLPAQKPSGIFFTARANRIGL